jgi:hypothetical protein
MKILWIEDFGAGNTLNPDPEGLAKSIFNGILRNVQNIFSEIDEDQEFDLQFTDLVQNKSLHDIHLCKNYSNWKKRFKDDFDYDIVLIDINLEIGSTKDDIPIGYADDFHQKAGFYIYHEILRKGFPDYNIAFFTGELGSFYSFKDSCINNSIPVPSNVFEKKGSDYMKISEWLKGKSVDKFLTLRRGIIDCCSEISKILKEYDVEEIDRYIIFNKAIKKNTNSLEFSDLKLYLDVLTGFFPFNSLSLDNKYKYYGFVKEISGIWERSKGRLNKESDISKDEFYFKNFCQNQMKLLRNWTAHNQLSKDLKEHELAFYFITAIRGIIDLPVTKICRYEKILLSIFDDVQSYLEEDTIKTKLADSWCSLRKVYDWKVNPSRIDFTSLLGDVYQQHNLDVSKSVKYFYQNLWHSIYPANLEIKVLPQQKDIVQLKISFNFKNIDYSIILKLLEAIYSESFN